MRRFVSLAVLALIPCMANAEWVVGGGFYNLSDEDGGIDVSLNAIVASVGFRFESGVNFAVMPELRIGTGVGDDTVVGVDVEIDSLLALSVRGQYEFDSGVYLFGAPAYANLDLKASAGGFSASDDEWEFGIGGGVGYRSNNVSGELSYETYDDTDVIGIAVKFWFQ